MSDTVSFQSSSGPERIMRVVALLGAIMVAGFALLSLYLGTIKLSELASGTTIAFAVVGFEALALLAAGFTAVYALRSRPRAIGMATACLAGTFATTATLSFMDLRANLPAGSPFQRAILISLLARGGFGGMILAFGLLGVLTRVRRSWVDLGLGLVSIVPVAVLAVVVRRFGTGWMTGSGETIGYLNVLGIVIGSALIGGCISASVHFVVTAFSRSRLEGDAPPPPGAPKSEIFAG